MRFKDRRGEVVYVDNGRGYQRESPKPKHVTGTDKERGPRGGRHRKRRELVESLVKSGHEVYARFVEAGGTLGDS